MRSKRLAWRAALCYTVGEIRAAHRAVRDIAVYRTYCRTEKKGRHIRAAKRQIEPRSARLPEARYFKTTSPQGDGNKSRESFFIRLLLNFKTTSPQGDGNVRYKIAEAIGEDGISKPHPRKGTETDTAFMNGLTFSAISKPHPRKGTETNTINVVFSIFIHFKTTSPQGDGNCDAFPQPHNC